MIGLFYCFIEAILPYLSKFYKSKLVSVLYGILEIQIKCEYTKPEEHMEKQINEKIIEIVHQANDMIPVEWDDLYIVTEMDKTYSGEAYFYFKYKNHYHYHLEMSEDFGLSMMDILSENKVLFKKSEDLKRVFIENDLSDWYICIIHLDDNNKLSVDYDYAPWLKSNFGPTARMNFFRYQFLGFEPRNEKELEQFKAMEAFQKEHNQK